MGELRARKRGKTWEYSFEGAKIDGKRKPISKGGFRTKGEALISGTKAKAEYDNCGRAFIPSEISLADYLDYWLENHVKKNLAHNTYLDYESKIRLHLKPDLGVYRLSGIESDVIQRWIDNKKANGLSKSMVKNMMSCLSGALRYAVIPCKYIKYNPCDYVTIGKIADKQYLKDHREYICSSEDYKKIIERFGPGTTFYIPCTVGYHLGTRVSETYGIDLLNDIDFKTHEIHIRHQLQKIENVWRYMSPKYDSFRTLRIGKTIEAIFKREITERKKNMLKYGEYYTKTYRMPDDSIVQARANIPIANGIEIMPASVKENGELLTPESFKYCARVCHFELNLPLFHSHCLRHTHGTILAENGASPKSIMERLGHRDIKVTMNTYVFNTNKMQQDTVDIFEAATS